MSTVSRVALACALALPVLSHTSAHARPSASRSGTGSSANGTTDWASSFWGGGSGGGTDRTGPGKASTKRTQEPAAQRTSAPSHRGLGPRPRQWCGWYMRSRHGGGPEFNLAATWRRYGSPAEPQIGAIVVWSHHVGEIVGRASNGQWIVLSGNDSGQVRERARSIAGATVRI